MDHFSKQEAMRALLQAQMTTTVQELDARLKTHRGESSNGSPLDLHENSSAVSNSTRILLKKRAATAGGRDKSTLFSVNSTQVIRWMDLVEGHE